MWRPAECRARRLGAPQSPLIRPCGPPSPLGGEGLLGAFYRLPPLGGKLASEARLMRGLTVEGRGYFAPGRGTFQGWKVPKDPRVVVLTKSAALRTPRCGHPSLRSLARPYPFCPCGTFPPDRGNRPLPTTTLGRGWVPGGSAPYDFRTRSTRLENSLNLFGAGVNLGSLCPPPAAARAGQIRRSFFPRIAPLVCLALSVTILNASLEQTSPM